MKKNTLHFIFSLGISSAVLFALLIAGVMITALVQNNLPNRDEFLLNSLFSL